MNSPPTAPSAAPPSCAPRLFLKANRVRLLRALEAPPTNGAGLETPAAPSRILAALKKFDRRSMASLILSSRNPAARCDSLAKLNPAIERVKSPLIGTNPPAAPRRAREVFRRPSMSENRREVPSIAWPCSAANSSGVNPCPPPYRNGAVAAIRGETNCRWRASCCWTSRF